MPMRSQITAIVALTFVVAGGLAYLDGRALSWAWFAPLSGTVATISLIAVCFERWAWRWRIFRGWLVGRPDFAGTWRCRLRSTYRDPESGEPVEKAAYAVIRQTLTTLSFRLYTDSARSHSIAEKIHSSDGDLFSLTVAYQNVPEVELRGGQSAIHYGCSHFDHIDHDADTLSGHYWTDRGTAGSIVLKERVGELASSFDAARKLFPAS